MPAGKLGVESQSASEGTERRANAGTEEVPENSQDQVLWQEIPHARERRC